MKPDAETTWTPADELEWTAFRYIANELPSAEAAVFERQLADDQHAREAVARCVQITHSVLALEEARAPRAACAAAAARGGNSRRTRYWSVAAVLAAATAVCFAFWIGTEYSQRDGDDSGERVARDERPPATDPANGKPAMKTAAGALDPSAVIATWLTFDTAVADGSEPSSGDGFALWDDPPKSSGSPPAADGSFNWVIVAVDEAPLAVPVPGKTPKEPN